MISDQEGGLRESEGDGQRVAMTGEAEHQSITASCTKADHEEDEIFEEDSVTLFRYTINRMGISSKILCRTSATS